MAHKQPTKEQQEIVWEGCGFVAVKHKDCYAPQTEYGKAHPEEICCYTYPDGTKGNNSFPELDLNNLFKYAVPKIIAKGHRILISYDIDVEMWKVEILHPIKRTVLRQLPKLENSLFWAIWEVMK